MEVVAPGMAAEEEQDRICQTTEAGVLVHDRTGHNCVALRRMLEGEFAMVA